MAYYKTQIIFKDESELKFLYDKNMRNFDVIQTLLKNNYNQEAATITRSLIESSIHFIYLLDFKDARKQYKDDSEILIFKNLFIYYKQTIADDKYYNGKINVHVEREKEALMSIFHKLSSNNQQKLLRQLNTQSFELNEKNIEKLDIFFRNFKPTFMNIEKMYKEILNVACKGYAEEKSAPITRDDELAIKYDFDLRGQTYQDYNICSQETHTIYNWTGMPDILEIAKICLRINARLSIYISCKYQIKLQEDLAKEMIKYQQYIYSR